MRVIVVGAGAMGTLFGVRLLRAGQDVRFIDADPERIDAVRRGGVCEEGRGDEAIRAPAGRAGDFSAPADLIILFTKGLHTAAAIGDVAGLLAPQGRVLTLQNGLGNDAVIAAVVGDDRVLIGMTTWPADLVGHGRVHVPGEGTIRMWSMTGEHSAVLQQVADTLNEAALGCTLDPGVRAGIWEKVVFNAALNGTAGLTGLTVGGMADCVPVRTLIDRLAEEGIAVALAAGVPISAQTVRRTIAEALSAHRGHKPSMLQDIEAGRPTEVHTILDALIAEAESIGLDVPHLATCAALIHGIDRRTAPIHVEVGST